MAVRIINRSMDIPIPERTVGYKGDNLVEIRTFELNRFYGDIDLSEFDFKLDTEINGTKNIIDLDKSVSQDKITLTWTIAESHILHPGRMSIQIRAFSQGEEKWHSALDYVIVQASINATEVQPDPLPSEFIQMEQRVTAMKNQAQEAAQTATEQANRAQGIADGFELTTLPAAITAVEAAVDEQVDIAASHADRAQGIADTFSNTTLPAAISAVEAAGQAKVDLAEQQVERVEDIIREAEQDVLPELRQAIEDGIETNDRLEESIREAGEAKTALDGSISSAGTAKNELDGSIAQAGTVKGELDSSIATAGQTKTALDESIATGELAEFKDDFTSHLNDYATYKDSNNLKVAKIEKELNDYQQTMASINVNQEAKQTASGYGVVSLPKNAANGQVSVSVFGNTETDEEGNTKSTISAMRLKSVGKNLFDINGEQIISGTHPNQLNYPPKIENGLLYSGGVAGSAAGGYLCFKNDVLNSTITISLTNSGQSGYCQIQTFDSIDSSNLMVNSVSKGILAVPIGAWSYTFTADKPYFGFAFFSATRYGMVMRDVQIERGAKTPYEPYTESTQYLPNVGELRSLPNGVCDEIRVSENKLIKRIGEKTNVASGTVINYSDMATGGQFVAYASNGTSQTGIKGDTLTITAITLTYQLAIPIEIPIEVSGTLLSYPSGTVYVEPIVADAGVYTDKIEVLHEDLPIKAIEKVSKVDFVTGVETELDIEGIAIAEDKLSFTHPDLVAGDIVFFEYEYDVESTQGEAEVEYYDSRYTIKDSVTDKFYKWNVTVADGVPSIELVEV